MTMPFYKVHSDCGGEIDVVACDAQEAADEAIQAMYDRGDWAAENPPAFTELTVVDSRGTEFVFEAAWDWSPSFFVTEK